MRTLTIVHVDRVHGSMVADREKRRNIYPALPLVRSLFIKEIPLFSKTPRFAAWIRLEIRLPNCLKLCLQTAVFKVAEFQSCPENRSEKL